MGSGGHERANRRGTTRKRTPGDRLAEAVHGRDGMDKERRKKGVGVTPLEKQEKIMGLTLTKDESQILYYLHSQFPYRGKKIDWNVIIRELKVIGIESNQNEFMQTLSGKIPNWMNYIPYVSVSLQYGFIKEISEFTTKFMKANRTD